jgi:hypothetical protein
MITRTILIELLEGEQREIAIKDYAIANLMDDEKQQRNEGFKRRAETTQEAIERNKAQRAKALLRASALTEAINKFPESNEPQS